MFRGQLPKASPDIEITVAYSQKSFIDLNAFRGIPELLSPQQPWFIRQSKQLLRN